MGRLAQVVVAVGVSLLTLGVANGCEILPAARTTLPDLALPRITGTVQGYTQLPFTYGKVWALTVAVVNVVTGELSPDELTQVIVLERPACGWWPATDRSQLEDPYPIGSPVAIAGVWSSEFSVPGVRVLETPLDIRIPREVQRTPARDLDFRAARGTLAEWSGYDAFEFERVVADLHQPYTPNKVPRLRNLLGYWEVADAMGGRDLFAKIVAASNISAADAKAVLHEWRAERSR